MLEELLLLGGRAKRLYAEALLARHRLSAPALVRVMTEATREGARAPEDMTAILVAVAHQGLADDALHVTFGDAVRSIASPAQQRRALAAWLETGKLG